MDAVNNRDCKFPLFFPFCFCKYGNRGKRGRKDFKNLGMERFVMERNSKDFKKKRPERKVKSLPGKFKKNITSQGLEVNERMG